MCVGLIASVISLVFATIFRRRRAKKVIGPTTQTGRKTLQIRPPNIFRQEFLMDATIRVIVFVKISDTNISNGISNFLFKLH